MKNTFLVSKVNLTVSIFFILSFGFFVTSILLKTAKLEDPITGTLVRAIDPALVDLTR